MAFKNLIAFGAGELTPELYERGNLDKFRTGLMRLRNGFVTKAGGLRGRGGLEYNMPAYTNYESTIKTVQIPYRDILFKFGVDSCVMYWDFNYTTFKYDQWTEVDLATGGLPEGVTYLPDATAVTGLQFSASENYLYCFSKGYDAFRIELRTEPTFNYDVDPPVPVLTEPIVEAVLSVVQPEFWNYDAASFTFDTSGGDAPTGYDIDYYVTSVVDGVESTSGRLWQGAKMAIVIGELNRILVTIDTTHPDYVANASSFIQTRVYRRPRNGGGYGFVGVGDRTQVGTDIFFTYVDNGVEADYTNSPPEIQVDFYSDTLGAIRLAPKSGSIYQGRLIVSGTGSENKAFGSRSNSTAFSRDFPIQDDSAVAFKVGSDGSGNINRFLESGGLFLFTNSGIYKTPGELLTPSTAFAVRRSSVVIDDAIQPIALGSNILCYSKKLKAVIKLMPTDTNSEYTPDELSIFSKHLLKGRRIVAMALEEGETQIVWHVLDNGRVLSLSYQEEQQLQSWAWHDTDGLFKDVIVVKTALSDDVVLFLVERNGVGSYERLTPNGTEDLKDYIGSDSTIVFKDDIIYALDEDDEPIDNELRITPIIPDTWDGELLLNGGAPGFFLNDPLYGGPGAVFRYFRESDGFAIDFTVTEFLDAENVKATASANPWTFLPDNQDELDGEDVLVITEKFYITRNLFEGLDHLEGKEVSVRLDGFTHASPLNTVKDYQSYTVQSGQITLVDNQRGAIVSIGLPYAQDIQTLNVDTIEQSPVKMISQLPTKLHVSYFESRGVFVGADFPDDDTVTNMVAHESQMADFREIEGSLSTTPIEPYTKREEIVIDAEWGSNGSVALRNVDPQPIGIRAIILDEELLGG